MKKYKFMKFSLFLVITLTFLGFVSMVSAASDKSKVTFRPLSDWETNNPSIFYTWGG